MVAESAQVQQYQVFDVSIKKRSARSAQYCASVVESPMGPTENVNIPLPLSSERVAEYLTARNRTLQRARAGQRIKSSDRELVAEIGRELFRNTFRGAVLQAFQRSLIAAKSQDLGLSIRLRLDDSLQHLPWELLSANEQMIQPLALSLDTPVTRFINLDPGIREVGPATVLHPLWMLIIIPTSAPVDAEIEAREIRTAFDSLVSSGYVKIDLMKKATVEMINNAVYKNRYHILHFICHGESTVDEEDPSAPRDGCLILDDAEGRPTPVSAQVLGFNLPRSDSLRLIVLNACEGAAVSASDPFLGVAQVLVGGYVPAVVGMQYSITNGAARRFASRFYEILSEGQTLDHAVTLGRIATTPFNEIEWATVVLFTRTREARLFRFPPKSKALAK